MTAAVLLNGYALNAGIRFTYIGCARMEAQAAATGAEPTRVVLATGRATSTAQASGVFTRLAYLTPSPLQAEAGAPAVDASRVMTVSVSGVTSGAEASGDSVRNAYMSPELIDGQAGISDLEPLRLAYPETVANTHDSTLNGMMLNGGGWRESTLSARAESTLSSETLATQLVKPGFTAIVGKASLAPLAYDLTRWMTPRVMRPRAISHAKERWIHELKVRQKYGEGTSIVRAHSRGTPNTILAFSINGATAYSSLASDKVFVSRDSIGTRSVGEARAFGTTHQQHEIRGLCEATASLVAAPDVTPHGGPRQAYAYAQGTAQAALSHASAVRWPMVSGVRQPAWAELNVEQLISRDVQGTATVYAVSMSDPKEAIITHAVYVEGTAEVVGTALAFEPTAMRRVSGRAEAFVSSSGEPWHWHAIPVDGVAEALAEVHSSNPPITRPVTGKLSGQAESEDTAYKVAYAAGQAFADGATLGEAMEVSRRMQSRPVGSSASASVFRPKVTRTGLADRAEGTGAASGEGRNTRVKGVPGLLEAGAQISLPWADKTDMVGARLLHEVWAVPGLLEGSGGLSRNIFKINADKPASDSRTVVVPFTDRFLVLSASSREYQIK